MRFRRQLVLVAAVVALSAAVAAGVTYILVRHDSPAAGNALPPIALVGVLCDTSGKPVPNAWVQLAAADGLHAKTGQRIPVHELAGAHSDATGRFTIRQSQSVPIIRKMAAENGGTVNFEVMSSKGGAGYSVWMVPRTISHHAWFADVFGTPASSKVERITYRPFGG